MVPTTTGETSLPTGCTGGAFYSGTNEGVISLSNTHAREHAQGGIRVTGEGLDPTETSQDEEMCEDSDLGEKILDRWPARSLLDRMAGFHDIDGAVLVSAVPSFIIGQAVNASG